MEDSGEDIESLVNQLVRDHHGKVDVIVAISYNDGKQKRYWLHNTPNVDQCQRLTRMIWESIKPGPRIMSPEEIEEEEE